MKLHIVFWFCDKYFVWKNYGQLKVAINVIYL